MDEDDIYGSILSDPKSLTHTSTTSHSSNSNLLSSNSHSEPMASGYTGPGISNPTPWLFISNLTWWTNEDDLRSKLGEGLCTRALSFHFIEHKPNGKSKGMVIVEFGDVETAEMAKDRLEGKEIHGKTCEVGFARNPPIKTFESKKIEAWSWELFSNPFLLLYLENPSYQRGPASINTSSRPPNYHQQQRIRPIEYEVDHNPSDQSRHVYRDDPGNGIGSNNEGHRIRYPRDSREPRDVRDSRDHYRDSRGHYHRESRTRSKSPDRRQSSSSHRY